MCGFANLSSIGILLGGWIVARIVRRLVRSGLERFTWDAAGTLSNLMSAALAGVLFTG